MTADKDTLYNYMVGFICCYLNMINYKISVKLFLGKPSESEMYDSLELVHLTRFDLF